jgi:hypothetical protein
MTSSIYKSGFGQKDENVTNKLQACWVNGAENEDSRRVLEHDEDRNDYDDGC